jgi:hypothetical protein
MILIDHLGAMQGCAGQKQRLSEPCQIFGQGCRFAQQEAVLKGCWARITLATTIISFFIEAAFIAFHETAYTLGKSERMSRFTHAFEGRVIPARGSVGWDR